MRDGDISNEAAPTMGIRFERVIKTEERKLNQAAVAYLQHISRSMDIGIVVLTTAERRKALAFLVKWAVPYNELIQADSVLEIPDIVRAYDMMSYFDTDRSILQNINSRGSGKVDTQLWTSALVS